MEKIWNLTSIGFDMIRLLIDTLKQTLLRDSYAAIGYLTIFFISSDALFYIFSSNNTRENVYR